MIINGKEMAAVATTIAATLRLYGLAFSIDR